MKETPSALFIIDQKRENTAIREAMSANIPVVGLIDTNADPTNIKFPIPGNDDAIRSIALIVKVLGSAVEEGYKEYEKNMQEAKAKREAAVAVETPKAAEIKPAAPKTDKPAAKKPAVKKTETK
jgi:small subunit ribosomal protein S2